jgi:hypothetical protein
MGYQRIINPKSTQTLEGKMSQKKKKKLYECGRKCAS